MGNIKNFIELTRGYTLPMTFASLLIILSYANYSLYFTFFDFALLSLALCSVHLGTNLFDDYIDIKSQIKNGVQLQNIIFSTPRKARLILDGTFSLQYVEKTLIILFTFAVLAGVYFIYKQGFVIVIYMLLGGLSSIFYPKSSKYYLAEIIVGLVFGPLMITGGYYALTGQYGGDLLLLSWTIFLTTIVLLHTHNIMDWEFDVKENRRTLALLCKTKQRAIDAQLFIIILAYTIIVLGIINLNFNPHMTYVFLTLPIVVKLQNSIKDYINIKDVEFIPRWYYGPFENWDGIKRNKLDFFMYRFYLARNFAFFFAVFASIGAVT